MRKNKVVNTLRIGLFVLLMLGMSACNNQTTPPPSRPATPTNLTALAKNAEVALSWTANTESNLKGYNIYWGTVSGALANTKLVAKPQTKTTIAGLTNGTKYFFAVDAENSSAEKSNKTTEVNATPQNNAAKPGDPESYAPGRSGEVKFFILKGKKYYYEVIDGLAIYEGDMILGQADQIDKVLAENSLIDTQGVTCDGSDWVFFYTRCNKWPNGVVRYQFKNDWGSYANNKAMQSRIRMAMAHWEENTNLRFVEASSGDRLLFRSSDGCSSQVGRIGSRASDTQNVNLKMKGCYYGSVVHEIGHAIGIFHEQSREDRDDFVRINRRNIELGKRHNFNKENSDARDIGPYDFGSIMHYGCLAFSRNGNNTIVPIVPGITCDDIGQRNGLSEGDILSEYFLYRPTFRITGITDGMNIVRGHPKGAGLHFDIEKVKSDYISWSSSRVAGSFATGDTASIGHANWPLGEHTITANVAILGVPLASHSVRVNIQNSPPVVDIFAPANRTEVCVNQNVTFRATAVDLDTLPSQRLSDAQISWYVGNSSTPFATGATARKSFGHSSGHGTFRIKVRGTDRDGGRHEDSIRIKVLNCTNNRPEVTILNPVDAPGSGPDIDVYPRTQDENGYFLQITLRGRATDTEDGNIPDSRLVWRTNRADAQPGVPGSGNQTLGTGRSLRVKLYVKAGEATTDHIISLIATDRDGNSTTETRLIRLRLLH